MIFSLILTVRVFKFPSAFWFSNFHDIEFSWLFAIHAFFYKQRFFSSQPQATGPRAAFFIHTQQKNAATFFFGKCYSWRLLATCCNFRLLQQKNDATFPQQNQISLILLQFICNIFVVLHAAHFFSPQHIFSWSICAAYLCSKCYCDFIIDIYLWFYKQ